MSRSNDYAELAIELGLMGNENYTQQSRLARQEQQSRNFRYRLIGMFGSLLILVGIMGALAYLA